MLAKRRFLPALTALLLAAFAVRLSHIGAQSIWFDEGWSAHAATQATIIDAANADATNPPLYYALLHGFVRFSGDSPLALRLFSTLFGLVTVALCALLARRLFGARAAVAAAFLAGFSPLLWWASQEARMYTLLAALVALAAVAWHALLRRPTAWAWIALWGAELGLLYAHNTGPVAALWLNAVTVVAWLTRRSVERPDWRTWIVGQGMVALLWSPYFFNRYLNLAEANSAVTSAPTPSLGLARDIWAAFWSGSWATVGRVPLLATWHDGAPFVGLSGVLLLVAIVLFPWRLPRARWLLLHAIVLSAGMVLGLMALGNELHGRYLTMVAPLLVVGLASGLARARPVAIRAAASGLFLLTFLVAAVYAHDPLYGHDDVEGMVRHYASTLDAGDTVVAWSYADRYDLAYYWPRLNVQARRVTLPEGADLEAVLPRLPSDGDVALNVWFTQRADYRGMMSCLLGHGTAAPPDTVTTYGMTSLTYHDPAPVAPDWRPFGADFGVARLEAIGPIPAFTAERALCLPVQITLLAPTASELKAALIALNPLGWEIARADAVFAQADQRTSVQLAAGSALTAYPLLRLPLGAPPGDYRLILRLYDDAHLSGYPVADGARGRQIGVGVWSAPPGARWNDVEGETDLPVQVEQAISEGLTLVAHDARPGDQPLRNGDTFRVTLLWRGEGPLPELRLADGDGRWRLPLPAPDGPRDALTRDWREATIPADAERGSAELRLDDGTVLATLPVEPVPATFTAPPFDITLNTPIPGIGALAGATVAEREASPETTLPVTLIWQAGENPIATGYTAFVQLLDSDGRLIAQSDSVPARGQRPTTGWRPGEFIVDEHALVFNEQAHPGPATIIAGLYDAATGERVRLSDGSDAIQLPVAIRVVGQGEGA